MDFARREKIHALHPETALETSEAEAVRHPLSLVTQNADVSRLAYGSCTGNEEQALTSARVSAAMAAKQLEVDVEEGRENRHLALGAASLATGAAAIADAGLYAKEGSYGSALLSGFSVIPGLGTLIAGTRLAKAGKKTIDLVQRAIDAGPNHWTATGNKLPASAQKFQRGLSGDYQGAEYFGGVSEASNLLKGETDTVGRFVSLVGGKGEKAGEVTYTSSVYARPLAIRGRIPDETTLHRRDDTAGIVSSLNLNQVEGVGFVTSSAEPSKWAYAYKEFIEKSGRQPSEGSRGERFLRELDDVLNQRKWGEVHPLYNARVLANPEEIEEKLLALYSRWGGKNPP